MAKGQYLRVGDKTTCGGVIITGDDSHKLAGIATAREGDTVTCGRRSGKYVIIGGIAGEGLHGRKFAGTLDSYSSCPCKARLISSLPNATYAK